MRLKFKSPRHHKRSTSKSCASSAKVPISKNDPRTTVYPEQREGGSNPRIGKSAISKNHSGNGGDDGTRTRDLCRDSSPNELTHDDKSEH